MPIFRYFIFVGGALLALLLGVNLVTSDQAGIAPSPVASSGESPPIRIRSDHKLPERVVIDTTQPIVVPSVKAAAAQPPVTDSSPALAELSAKARVRDTFAQFVPERERKAEVAKPEATRPEATKAEAKPLPQPKRKVARARTVPPHGRPMMLVAQQPHFGFFNTW